MELLQTLKASSPVFPSDLSKIIFVNKEDPVDKGFKILIDNNILSTPVYDQKEKRYVSFFSMIDLIHEILQIVSSTCAPQGDISTVLTQLCNRNIFNKHRVCDIANKSQREPFIFVNSDVKLDEVARLMVRNKLHRVAVLDQRGDLCNIISLSRIIECISQLFGIDEGLTNLGYFNVGQLPIGKNETIRIREDKLALDAFKLIAKLGISGVAVVDHEDKIVGVISDHDLNIIKSHGQYLSLLYQPISEYLEALRKLTDCPKTVITCKSTDTFKDIVQKVAENKIHRIFVVNAHGNLEGVISLMDILEQIVNYQKEKKQ